MEQYAQQRKSNLIAKNFLWRRYVAFYLKNIFIATSSNMQKKPDVTSFHKYRYVSNALIHIQILNQTCLNIFSWAMTSFSFCVKLIPLNIEIVVFLCLSWGIILGKFSIEELSRKETSSFVQSRSTSSSSRSLSNAFLS